MPATYCRSYDGWLATLRDAARRDDPRVDVTDLIEAAAADLATYHPAVDDPYNYIADLPSEHYAAAHVEADYRFNDDADDALARVYNVAWSAIYLYFFDRFDAILTGRVPDPALEEPPTARTGR